MRTLFIVSDKRVENHVGEEYDSILEVDDQPTTVTIKELALRVRNRIRALWKEQEKNEDTVVDPKVVCHLDAASPFVTMLLDLRLIMGEEEGIIIELPFYKEEEPKDPEAKSLLEKIGRNG